MKERNFWHFTWIISLYAVLITILYLVVVYKVKWEDRDLNDYLYFYNCGEGFCTTLNKVDNYYSTIRCDKFKCPTIIDSKDNLVILRDNGKEYLFDYKLGQVINDNYNKYAFTKENDHFIVGDASESYGIIDLNGDIVVPLKYSKIVDYKNNLAVYEEEGHLGIESTATESIKIKPEYEDIILISDLIFAGKKEDVYEIYSLSQNKKIGSNTYNYLYPYNGIILTLRNGQMDIIDYNLKSKMIMKVNTYYPYTSEEEQGTLNIKADANTLRFTIYTSDTEYTNYLFDIKSSKLFS